MFEGTLVTSYLSMFISLFDEKTVNAINEIIKSAAKLKTNASLITKGLLRLADILLKLTNPLLFLAIVDQLTPLEPNPPPLSSPIALTLSVSIKLQYSTLATTIWAILSPLRILYVP